MIYDYFRVIGAHDTVLDYAELFSVTLDDDNIQDAMKFYCLCHRFHPMIFWKVCTNSGYVGLRNSKSYWNCTTWEDVKCGVPSAVVVHPMGQTTAEDTESR